MYPFNLFNKRELREKLYKSYINRADNDNERDNSRNYRRTKFSLRIQKANLFGFDTACQHVLENTMAKSTSRVNNLIDVVWDPGLKRAKRKLRKCNLISKRRRQF